MSRQAILKRYFRPINYVFLNLSRLLSNNMSQTTASLRDPSTSTLTATSRWCDDTEALFLPYPYSNAPASFTAIGHTRIHTQFQISDWTLVPVNHKTRKRYVGMWVGKINKALSSEVTADRRTMTSKRLALGLVSQ